jgi:hypothetical protein
MAPTLTFIHALAYRKWAVSMNHMDGVMSSYHGAVAPSD